MLKSHDAQFLSVIFANSMHLQVVMYPIFIDLQV